LAKKKRELEEQKKAEKQKEIEAQFSAQHEATDKAEADRIATRKSQL